MPEGDKFVTAGAFLENAKPRSMKMSEFFNLQEKKKANSTKIQDFWDQVVEKKAKADKAAKEAQEALEAKAKAEAEKEARAQQKSGRALSEEDDIPMTFGDPSDEVEEEAPEAEKKSLYREVRDVLYKEGEYEGMNALARRLADIRVMAQIVRAGYVEGKREARDWFYHTKFGQAVKDKSETLKKFGSTCLDYAAAGYKGMKNLVSTGAEKTKKGLKAAYQFVAERAKVAKERFVNTPEVQWASRKMRQYDEMVSAAGKSMARSFRKLFGIRELTEEEKKQRAEEKRKKAEEKEAKKNQEKTEKEAKKKEEKSAKEKLKAEKKAEKEFQKKLKALKKAMEAEKDPSKLEKMAADFKEATVNGLASLGDRYDELMKTIDLSVQSQVQKDDIDEIIRRRADKSYDKRMKEFKRWLHEDPDKDKKLKYRLNSDQWKEEFEAAKKRAEEEKKKKQNGGKAAEDKKEEVKKEEVKKEETKAEGEKETEKKEPEKKEEKQLGIIESIDNLAGKISTTKKKLDKIKKGQIGSGADLVKDLQNFKTAFSNLQTELKKKKEEEEQKKAEAEAKTEEKTEAQAENTTESTESTEKTEEKTETKTEEKSKLQQIKEKTKEIADNTVKAVGTAYTDIKTGIAIQENVGTIVDDVQKLVSGQGSEKEAAEAIKKSTDTLKKAGSFFGWDPSKGTAYVDKGADTLALFGKTRQDLTDRMKKIKEGKASAEDYLAFETGLSTLAQNCLSYANIDTPYINSFNKALTGMVKISKGEKVTENILNVGQQLLSTANAIEKQITGTGSLGTPIAILGSMEKIAGNMESLVEKTEQNQRLKGMSGEEIGKGVTKEEAGLISNVRDDIVGRNDISRYQLLGGAVKNAAETTAAVVGGTIGTLYMKAAQPAFDALNRFMTEAMTKSLNKALIRKDIWGTEDNYRIDREMKGMRNDEIMRILRRETGSINGQHLADKIRFDLGMRLMTNADKNNGFEALVQNAFGRKATDEEIMQLVGFKDFKDAENRVYKAVENDNKLKSDFTKKGKDVLAKPSKAEKEQAKKDKAYQNILDELNNILDTDESPALLAEDEKKKIPLFPEDNKKNKTSFKDTHASKKHKEKGL